jgi:RHS repeat-associated protein
VPSSGDERHSAYRFSHFTGKERDGESGLDFFQARYYGAALGRFTSPDPMNAGADWYNPQSWNGYAYVLGNPLAMTDPSGLNPCENNTGCLAGIAGCKENMQACQGASFVSDPFQGIIGSFDPFRLLGIPGGYAYPEGRT